MLTMEGLFKGFTVITIHNHFSEFLDEQFGDLNPEFIIKVLKKVEALRFNESEINALMNLLKRDVETIKRGVDIRKELIESKSEIKESNKQLNKILGYLNVASIDELKEELDDADIESITENCNDDKALYQCYIELTGQYYMGDVYIDDFKERLKVKYNKDCITKINGEIESAKKTIDELNTELAQLENDFSVFDKSLKKIEIEKLLKPVWSIKC